MLIRKNDVEALSGDIRKIIDGADIDVRDNREGAWSVLKNDIHTLANLRSEQAAALQRERDLMKDMLADVSHQLITPLTSMTLMADLLDEAPPDKRAEFAANIRSSLARMEWLVSSLLKMAKLDAGAVEFSRDSVRSEEVIARGIEPVKLLLDLRGQTVEILGEADVACDVRWTAEALTNVVKNASEHSPQGSVLRIESGENPLCTWISVTDAGEGMTTAEIARIFTRFEGSRSEQGYGIGLPLALAIMRGQTGDIDVDGGSGTGATITLKFYGREIPSR